MSTPGRPLQPHRISNSFCKEELELLAVALQRIQEFSDLPGGLAAADYEVITQIMHAALRGGDIRGLIRSNVARSALGKLDTLRRWAQADLTSAFINREAQAMATEKVAKMLARARLQAVQAEATCG